MDAEHAESSAKAVAAGNDNIPKESDPGFGCTYLLSEHHFIVYHMIHTYD
jgi:hypothetical protein